MDYEKKPVSLITTAAGMAATITAMIIGSLFGAKGSLWGAALGSGVSATAATVYENTARKARARLKAVREQEDVDAHPDKHPLQAQLGLHPLGRGALIRARELRILGHHSPWKTALVGAGITTGCFVVAIVILLGVEAATGKTLHSDLTGKAQYGNSFSYSTKAPESPSPAPSSAPASSPVPSSSSPSPSATASPDPDAAPTPSGGTPSGPTGTPTSSVSATPQQNGPTAPAANAVPSSSSATGR